MIAILSCDRSSAASGGGGRAKSMRTVYAVPVTSSFPSHTTADSPIRRHLNPGQSAAIAAI